MEEQGGRVPKKSLTSTSEIKASKSNVVQQVNYRMVIARIREQSILVSR
jgi:hypothetical protein